MAKNPFQMLSINGRQIYLRADSIAYFEPSPGDIRNVRIVLVTGEVLTLEELDIREFWYCFNEE